MKKTIATLLTWLGLSAGAHSGTLAAMNPNEIFFSIPTISNDVPKLEAPGNTNSATEVTLNEDDWTQVEFYASVRLPEIKLKLIELKAFEKANRTGKIGWKNVYVRKIDRAPVIAGANPLAHLEAVLRVKAGGGPLLTSGGHISGRVKQGFTLALGGNVTLYGYTADDGITVLGASVGANPDNAKLAEAFAKLSASDHLILVDWRSQMLITGTHDGNIDIWRP